MSPERARGTHLVRLVRDRRTHLPVDRVPRCAPDVADRHDRVQPVVATLQEDDDQSVALARRGIGERLSEPFTGPDDDRRQQAHAGQGAEARDELATADVAPSTVGHLHHHPVWARDDQREQSGLELGLRRALARLEVGADRTVGVLREPREAEELHPLLQIGRRAATRPSRARCCRARTRGSPSRSARGTSRGTASPCRTASRRRSAA